MRLSLVQIGAHPEAPSFHGLGELTGAQLAGLMSLRRPVTTTQLDVARRAWAFRAPEPGDLVEVAGGEEPAMPFLADASRRFTEEYPSVRDGLSRTQRQLLAAGAAGVRHRHEYYRESKKFERCPWGDASVYLRLDGLAAAERPALDRVGAGQFAITAQGRRLLAGEDDWVRSRNEIDVWPGGVHLTGTNAE